jgi:hypothetical protein
MIIVAVVKYARVSTSIPTVNMWCAHTTNRSSPKANMADTNTSRLTTSVTKFYAMGPNFNKIIAFFVHTRNCLSVEMD